MSISKEHRITRLVALTAASTVFILNGQINGSHWLYLGAFYVLWSIVEMYLYLKGMKW